MVESKSKLNYELEQALFEVLNDNFREDAKPESFQFPFANYESEQVDKERSLKKWKKSEGYYYLNPEKFKFSLKNL